MTPKELRAAAEITQHFLENDKDDLNMIAGLVGILARHILATVREDDREELSIEFVRNSGLPLVKGSITFFTLSPNLELVFSHKEDDDTFVWAVWDKQTKLTEIRKRCQFRKLCEGLGIAEKGKE